MSPEQAEGKKLDVRSDIFSFGAVLYEMLTGRRAFQGDSKVSTLSAILKDDPKPPENIQSDLEKIVRRCLRKDPARRFQRATDSGARIWGTFGRTSGPARRTPGRSSVAVRRRASLSRP